MSKMVNDLKIKSAHDLSINSLVFKVPTDNGLPAVFNPQKVIDIKFLFDKAQSDKILQLAELPNSTRKEVARGTIKMPPNSPMCNKVGSFIQTNHFTQNGGLTSTFCRTLTCALSHGLIVPGPIIRRLTPIECERLQGYPDNMTKFGKNPHGGKYEITARQRYKMCGNGISSPVAKTIIESFIGPGEIRVMSTFSGCGGTEALLDPRFKVIGHSEIDKHASAVLDYNHPNIPNFGDITAIDSSTLPPFDLFLGGFPCPSYSIAGNREGMKDPRGKLIFHVFRILEETRPEFFILENVKGLLSHEKGESLLFILRELSKLGYSTTFELVNSLNFGLTHSRERVFILGKLEDQTVLDEL